MGLWGGKKEEKKSVDQITEVEEKDRLKQFSEPLKINICSVSFLCFFSHKLVMTDFYSERVENTR